MVLKWCGTQVQVGEKGVHSVSGVHPSEVEQTRLLAIAPEKHSQCEWCAVHTMHPSKVEKTRLLAIAPEKHSKCEWCAVHTMHPSKVEKTHLLPIPRFLPDWRQGGIGGPTHGLRTHAHAHAHACTQAWRDSARIFMHNTHTHTHTTFWIEAAAAAAAVASLTPCLSNFAMCCRGCIRQRKCLWSTP